MNEPATRDDQAYPAPGSRIAEKYEVVRLIGRGGMGAVLEAFHTRTERRVAIKWLLPELVDDAAAVARFEHEAKASGRIDHPNVVGIHDFGEFEGSYYLVMDYLEGRTLGACLEEGPLGVTECALLMLPVLRGVAAAHDRGVIHRDLKPDNIFLPVDRNGLPRPPKVLDFGISKLERRDARDLEITRAGEVVGTPYYMSPEQSQGKGDVDARTDVFSLGIILYECLTGRRPFTGESYAETLVKIATEDATPVDMLAPEVRSELAAVIETAMAKVPSERFSSVAELGRALAGFAGQSFDGGADWTGSFSATGTRAVTRAVTLPAPSTPAPMPSALAPAAEDDDAVTLPVSGRPSRRLVGFVVAGVLGLVALMVALSALGGSEPPRGEGPAGDAQETPPSPVAAPPVGAEAALPRGKTLPSERLAVEPAAPPARRARRARRTAPAPRATSATPAEALEGSAPETARQDPAPGPGAPEARADEAVAVSTETSPAMRTDPAPVSAAPAAGPAPAAERAPAAGSAPTAADEAPEAPAPAPPTMRLDTSIGEF